MMSQLICFCNTCFFPNSLVPLSSRVPDTARTLCCSVVRRHLRVHTRRCATSCLCVCFVAFHSSPSIHESTVRQTVILHIRTSACQQSATQTMARAPCTSCCPQPRRPSSKLGNNVWVSKEETSVQSTNPRAPLRAAPFRMPSLHHTSLPRRLCSSEILLNSVDFHAFSKFTFKFTAHVGNEVTHRACPLDSHHLTDCLDVIGSL